MTTRNRQLLIIAIPVGLFVIAFLFAQILAAGFNAKLSSFIKDQKGIYAVLAKSYQSDTDQLGSALQEIANNKKLPSFKDKILASGDVFSAYQSGVLRIARSDAKYVKLLKKDVPKIAEVPGLAAINPSYDNALEKQTKLRKLIVQLDRAVATEMFLATKHKEYFSNMADVQTFIALEFLTKLIDVFSAAAPGENGDTDKKQKIKEYEQAVNTMIPGLTRVLKASPMPSHPYYANMRHEALDMLAKSEQMFNYNLDWLKNGNSAAKEKADALAQQDDGKLLRYRTIVTDSLLAPYSDAGLMERATSQLFEL